MTLLLLLFVSSVIAGTEWPSTLQSRETQERQGWTAEPDCGSGTVSILWQCLTTIFLCAYVSVHLNIPPLSLSKGMAFVRRIFTIGAGVLMPELWAWLAALDLVAARRFRKSTERLDCGVTLKQAFFICSGGMAIKGLHGVLPLLKPLDVSRQPITAHSGTMYIHESIWKKRSDLLSDKEITFLAKNVPSDEEIDDKSKQDSLAKLIAMLQVLWTLIQIIARGQQGLTIPLIQVATLGYIAMALSSYICWWSKPYDVGTPHGLEPSTIFDTADNDNLRIYPGLWLCASKETRVNSFLKFVPKRLLPQVPQFVRWKTAWDNDTFSSTASIDGKYLGLLTIAFSAIHCTAWYYSFPTVAEAWTWRVLMLFSVCFGIGIVLLSTPSGKALFVSDKFVSSADRLIGPFAQIYLAARLYMIVECFISFRDAPADVYQQIDWSAYVPHFGA
ncbi:hypothetical protein MMC10_000548 [Thelotrema lepadinum]|nr:hypothetical protein [Thelotrema lepadinum]